ncbi:MAG: C45 family autoproteolytic acyltransferase/hydrolase [Polaromonas sp.]
MSNKQQLSYLPLSGTAFEIGNALGKYGAHSVQSFLLGTEVWARIMRWRGSPQVIQMAKLVAERFPRYLQELQGLAHGLGMPFEDVFLWNCRGDLDAMVPDGCTTIQIPGETGTRFLHNEDGLPGFAGHCAIAEVNPQGGKRFASFVYPGSLPGHTFAVSGAGLAITVNNLRLRSAEPGLPRMVLTRALLDTTDLEAALSLVESVPRSGGFHLTLAQQGSARLMSVEFSSKSCSIREITRPSLHANHRIHPKADDLPQVVTRSSEMRQQRGDQLLADAQGQLDNPLTILHDRSEQTYPIYRESATDPDDENTLATADIRVGLDGITWDVYTDLDRLPNFRMINASRKT